MSDDRLLLDVRAWLQGEAVDLPDPERAGRRIAAALPRQRARPSGILPWRRWYQRSAHPLVGTLDVRAGPATASNGHRPPITRRTQSMLTPVKAIAAGTLVLAVGFSLAIVGPVGPTDTLPPGAEGATSTGAVRVAGTVLHASCTAPTRTIEAEIVRERGTRCEPQTWAMNDPRLSGTASVTWNADTYRFDGADATVIAESAELRNEAGAWRCQSGPWVADGSGLSVTTVPTAFTCTGLDGYEGQTAILTVDMDAGTVEGVVFAGDPPAWPEAAGE